MGTDMESNESIEWIGYAPSGKKIGRITAPAGFARYVTFDKTDEIGDRIEVIFDSRHVNEDILYAMTLNFQRLACMVDRRIYENPKER